MSFKYVRDYYNVPAKRGGRIRHCGKTGTMTSATHYIFVRFDGDNKGSVPIHPTDENLEYIGKD